MKYSVCSIVILAFSSALINCSPVHDQLSSSEAWSLNSAESLSIYENTLFPLLKTNCGSCHGVSQQPTFAVANSQLSYDSLTNDSLVDLTAPGASRIVVKIKGGHSGISAAVGSDLEIAITTWATELKSP